jgi:phosphatidylserine/phosphatidylglycerophosphate/cardiolipin synthase-like enzyme
VKLLVLPDDGMAPVIGAIKSAKTSIDTTIFRFDRLEVEKALEAAVGRGVRVRTLIAHTNRGGEKLLRKLEQRLLGAGITVARSGDDLSRYHAKFMVIDGRTLYVMLFNYTALDVKSRSFAVITTKRAPVAEAMRLFEADASRQPCEPQPQALVVSPDNARKKLTEFIKGAKKSLWLYDPKISDGSAVRLLEERVKKGVEVRVLGTVGKRAKQFKADRMKSLRLHARVIIRDGRDAFFGSQSLRTVELDGRREVGLIVNDAKVVKTVAALFDKDWSETKIARAEAEAAQKEEAAAETKATEAGAKDASAIATAAASA